MGAGASGIQAPTGALESAAKLIDKINQQKNGLLIATNSYNQFCEAIRTSAEVGNEEEPCSLAHDYDLCDKLVSRGLDSAVFTTPLTTFEGDYSSVMMKLQFDKIRLDDPSSRVAKELFIALLLQKLSCDGYVADEGFVKVCGVLDCQCQSPLLPSCTPNIGRYFLRKLLVNLDRNLVEQDGRAFVMRVDPQKLLQNLSAPEFSWFSQKADFHVMVHPDESGDETKPLAYGGCLFKAVWDACSLHDLKSGSPVDLAIAEPILGSKNNLSVELAKSVLHATAKSIHELSCHTYTMWETVPEPLLVEHGGRIKLNPDLIGSNSQGFVAFVCQIASSLYSASRSCGFKHGKLSAHNVRLKRNRTRPGSQPSSMYIRVGPKTYLYAPLVQSIAVIIDFDESEIRAPSVVKASPNETPTQVIADAQGGTMSYEPRGVDFDMIHLLEDIIAAGGINRDKYPDPVYDDILMRLADLRDELVAHCYGTQLDGRGLVLRSTLDADGWHREWPSYDALNLNLRVELWLRQFAFITPFKNEWAIQMSQNSFELQQYPASYKDFIDVLRKPDRVRPDLLQGYGKRFLVLESEDDCVLHATAIHSIGPLSGAGDYEATETDEEGRRLRVMSYYTRPHKFWTFLIEGDDKKRRDAGSDAGNVYEPTAEEEGSERNERYDCASSSISNTQTVIPPSPEKWSNSHSIWTEDDRNAKIWTLVTRITSVFMRNILQVNANNYKSIASDDRIQILGVDAMRQEYIRYLTGDAVAAEIEKGKEKERPQGEGEEEKEKEKEKGAD